MSEGDKSAGIGSGYVASSSVGSNPPHHADSYEFRFTSFLNDRSDLISRTSSNFVELGVRNSISIDPPTDDEKEEEESASTADELLVGLTVQGSKKKKKKRRKKSLDTEDNESNSDDCSDGQQSSSSRKPQDPDGVVWNDVVKRKNVIDAPGSLQSKGRPNVRSTGANTDRCGQKYVSKNKTPNLHSEARCEVQKTEQSLKRTSLTRSLDIIKEDEPDNVPEKKCENDDFDNVFDNVMSRAKMCLTSVEASTRPVQTLITNDGFPLPNEVESRPNETEPGCIATSEVVETREADDEGDSSIKNLRSRFETDSSGSGPKPGRSKVSMSANLSARRKAKSLVRAKKQDDVLSTQSMSSPTPESTAGGGAIDVKDPESSDVNSFSKLRSRFEPQKSTSVADMSKPRDKAVYAAKSYQVESATTTQPIGRIYLKNSLQAMSSLGSETFDTASSQKSSEDTLDDGTLGDGTINTKKVLRYAKKLERREREKSDIENDSSKSFDQSIDKRDTLSSKENHCESEVVEKKGDETSIIAKRKKAFESSSGRQSKPLWSIAAANSTSAANKPPQEISSKPPLETLTPTRNPSPTSNDSPVMTSVKDRIAVFSGRKQPPPQHQASPLRNALPRQPQNHQTPPPRTISTNGNNKSPSPLWTTNRTTGKPFSPNNYGVQQNQAGHRNLTRGSPARPTYASTSPPTKGDDLRRPRNLGAIDTSYESPIATRKEFADDDDDDGITLSPTLSEVSGLTMPTCLGTVASGTLGSNRGSDLFDDLPSIAPISPASALNRGPNFHEAMSPIARHRQQQKSAVVRSFSSNKLPDRPQFNKEVNSSPQTPSAMSNRLHELKTPRARGSPGGPKAAIQSDNSSKPKPEKGNTMTRREQIVSRVRASPRSSYLPQPSPSKRVLTKSQEWPERNSIRERPSLSKSTSSEKTNSVQSNSTEGKPVHHFDGRASETAKTRSTVAERVARANKMANKRQVTKPQPREDSLATRDCIRVD